MKGRGPGPEDAARPLVWIEQGDAGLVEVEACRLGVGGRGDGAGDGAEAVIVSACADQRAIASSWRAMSWSISARCERCSRPSSRCSSRIAAIRCSARFDLPLCLDHGARSAARRSRAIEDVERQLLAAARREHRDDVIGHGVVVGLQAR